MFFFLSRIRSSLKVSLHWIVSFIPYTIVTWNLSQTHSILRDRVAMLVKEL